MPNEFNRTLIEKIKKLAVKRDVITENLVKIKKLLLSKTQLNWLQEKLALIKQPAYLLRDKIDFSKWLMELKNIQKKLLEENEKEIANHFEVIIKEYQNFFEQYQKADESGRKQLAIPFATMSGENLEECFYLTQETARQITCRNSLGLVDKKNQDGNRAVCALGGVHFKPNPERDHIKIAQEYFMSFFAHFFSNKPLTAATTAIKIGDIAIKEIFKKEKYLAEKYQSLPDALKNTFSEQAFNQHQAIITSGDFYNVSSQCNSIDEIFEKKPEWKNNLIVLDSEFGVVVQCGETVPGESFYALLQMYQFLDILKKHAQPERIIAFLKRFFNDSISCDLNVTEKSIQEIMAKHDKNMFGKISYEFKGKITLHQMYQLALWLDDFPEILKEQDITVLVKLIDFPKMAKRIYAKIKGKEVAQISVWGDEQARDLILWFEHMPKKIKSDLFQFSVLFSQLTNTDDCKADNFIAVIEPEAISVIGIDNDGGLEQAVFSKNQKHFVNIKNVLYTLEGMHEPLHEEVKARFKGSVLLNFLQFLNTFFIQQKKYYEWMAYFLNKDDLETAAEFSQPEKKLDIPFYIYDAVLDGMYQKWLKAQKAIEENPNITLFGLHQILNPIVAEIYQIFTQERKYPLLVMDLFYRESGAIQSWIPEKKRENYPKLTKLLAEYTEEALQEEDKRLFEQVAADFVVKNLPEFEQNLSQWEVIAELDCVKDLKLSSEQLNKFLYKSIVWKKYSLMKLFLRCGADPNFIQDNLPLPYLITDLTALQILQQYGAHFEMQHEKCGTLLDFAMTQNNIDLFFGLVKLGAGKKANVEKLIGFVHKLDIKKYHDGLTQLAETNQEFAFQYALQEVKQFSSLNKTMQVDFVRLKIIPNPEDGILQEAMYLFSQIVLQKTIIVPRKYFSENKASFLVVLDVTPAKFAFESHLAVDQENLGALILLNLLFPNRFSSLENFFIHQGILQQNFIKPITHDFPVIFLLENKINIKLSHDFVVRFQKFLTTFSQNIFLYKEQCEEVFQKLIAVPKESCSIRELCIAIEPSKLGVLDGFENYYAFPEKLNAFENLPKVTFEKLSVSGAQATKELEKLTKEQTEIESINAQIKKGEFASFKKMLSDSSRSIILGKLNFEQIPAEHQKKVLEKFQEYPVTHLNLNKSIIDSNIFLKIVKKAAFLREVNLSGTQVVLEGIEPLKQFPYLEILNLSGVSTTKKLQGTYISLKKIVVDGAGLIEINLKTPRLEHFSGIGLPNVEKIILHCNTLTFFQLKMGFSKSVNEQLMQIRLQNNGLQPDSAYRVVWEKSSSLSLSTKNESHWEVFLPDIKNQTIYKDSNIKCFSFDPRGNLLYFSGLDGVLYRYDLNTKQRKEIKKYPGMTIDQIFVLPWSAVALALTKGVDHRVLMLNAVDFEPLFDSSFSLEWKINFFRYHDGYLIAFCENGVFKMFDLYREKNVATKLFYQKQIKSCLSLFPYLIMGFNDGTLVKYNLQTTRIEFSMLIGKMAISALCLLRNDYIAAGSLDGKIYIIDLEKKQVTKNWLAHNNYVVTLALIQERYLFSVGFTGEIKVWIINESACLQQFSIKGSFAKIEAVAAFQYLALSSSGEIFDFNFAKKMFESRELKEWLQHAKIESNGNGKEYFISSTVTPMPKLLSDFFTTIISNANIIEVRKEDVLLIEPSVATITELKNTLPKLKDSMQLCLWGSNKQNVAQTSTKIENKM